MDEDKKIILFTIKNCMFDRENDFIIMNDAAYMFENFKDSIKNTLSKLGTISSLEYKWKKTEKN